MESTDPDRFAVRSKYLAGVGTHAVADVAIQGDRRTLRRAERGGACDRPAARLAVVTPSLDGGPAGSEARRVDRAALPPSQSWRSVGLDLQAWPSGPGSPLVLRGTALSTEALSHDLATSPDLDSLVASRLIAACCSRSAANGPGMIRAARARIRRAGEPMSRLHPRIPCPSEPEAPEPAAGSAARAPRFAARTRGSG